VRIDRTGQDEYIPPHLSKDQDILVREGDRVHVSTPGGGGFGNPMKRDPVAVLRDVKRGYYTVIEAQALFGVVIRDDEVDESATISTRTG
jgi:N-methylhydantoinase B